MNSNDLGACAGSASVCPAQTSVFSCILQSDACHCRGVGVAPGVQRGLCLVRLERRRGGPASGGLIGSVPSLLTSLTT